MTCRPFLQMSPVVPVLTIVEVKDAVPLARALVAGGLKVLEITLRTPVALEAMKRIAGEVPGAVIAAGTVTRAEDLDRAAKAGAQFAFSPGLADFMVKPQAIPILPGVATASDIMKGMIEGMDTFKFFPAVPAGGVGALKAFAGPFASVAFCPTGGIGATQEPPTQSTLGSLMNSRALSAPMDAIAAGDWGRIEALAKDAAALTA